MDDRQTRHLPVKPKLADDSVGLGVLHWDDALEGTSDAKGGEKSIGARELAVGEGWSNGHAVDVRQLTEDSLQTERSEEVGDPHHQAAKGVGPAN
jgi:hypothetical protein